MTSTVRAITKASFTLLAITTLAAGCSAIKKDFSGLDYEPQVRNTQEVEREVGDLSRKILGMLKVNGKVIDSQPDASHCDAAGNGRKYLAVRHPWSLYGVGNDALGKGMENLHKELPERGWTVVKFGKDSSRNRNLELMAAHRSTHTQLEATWIKGLDGHTPLIEFSVYSRCFEEKS